MTTIFPNTISLTREDEPQIIYFQDNDLDKLAKQVNAWLGEHVDRDWSIISNELVLDHYLGHNDGKAHGYIQAITIVIHHKEER
jgi:hypothetical protein